MDGHNLIYERKKQPLVYASFPQISDLCCAICEIDFIEVQDSTKTSFHWQTMKCRLLIHLIFDVIASPVSGTEKYIFVIAHKQSFEMGKLERILRNFKLVFQGLRTVTPELYKTCLQYTIQTKVAPLWNKIADRYIRGKEFYNAIGGSEALTLEILVDERGISLQLHAEEIKVPYIKLEDYLPSSVVSQFLADPKGYINLSRYNFPFVYVLPSTKKGKLLSVSKEIPAGSAFKDYGQLRRHWKNMYGYSLPKISDGILYYEIKFLIAKSKIFTYPNLCVTSGPLDITSNKDKESTITQFLSDMLVKLPTVCDKQLQISKHNPFNTTCSSINPLSNLMPKDKGSNTCLKEIDNTDSESGCCSKYTDHYTKSINSAPKLLKTQLAKIHEIHSVQLCENMITDFANKNMDIQCLNNVQNIATRSIESSINENNITERSNDNSTITNDITISTYFKYQEPHSSFNKGERSKKKEQEHLTLKEKLLKAKWNKNCGMSAQGMVHNINVEEMAKSNELHKVKTSVLSDWLNKHSIPHNSRGKKTELINKVLSHMKNTQILQQFRV